MRVRPYSRSVSYGVNILKAYATKEAAHHAALAFAKLNGGTYNPKNYAVEFPEQGFRVYFRGFEQFNDVCQIAGMQLSFVDFEDALPDEDYTFIRSRVRRLPGYFVSTR